MINIIYGFILFCMLFMIFIILLRFFKSRSPATIICLTSLIIYMLGLGSFVLVGIPLKIFEFSASYWFFSFSMMMVFFAVYKSISLRMMLNLQRGPSNLSSILSNYIAHESYKVRLEILIKNQFIVREKGEYYLTSKGKQYALFILGIQKAFNINRSG